MYWGGEEPEEKDDLEMGWSKEEIKRELKKEMGDGIPWFRIIVSVIILQLLITTCGLEKEIEKLQPKSTTETTESTEK